MPIRCPFPLSEFAAFAGFHLELAPHSLAESPKPGCPTARSRN